MDAPDGWMFTVNDTLSNVSASLATVQNGDQVLWFEGTTENRFQGPSWEELTGTPAAISWVDIETVDDLFDAFNTSADIVMGAYHSSVSDAELEDIHSVSDSFVPVVYAVGGRAVLRQGKPGDLLVTLSALADIGFYRTCVLDTDGSVTEATWEEIFDGFPSAVPFTRRRSGPEGPSRLWVSCLRARGCPR